MSTLELRFLQEMRALENQPSIAEELAGKRRIGRQARRARILRPRLNGSVNTVLPHNLETANALHEAVLPVPKVL